MKSIQIVFFFGMLSLAFTANALTLSSPAFDNNGVIPNKFTYSLGGQCSGENISPPLIIGDVPEGTKSFAITVFDPDGGNWLHWKAWNIDANTLRILENASAFSDFSQANNDFGSNGYGGPCPPTPNHHYSFTLYALNGTFSSAPSVAQLQSSAIQTATYTGLRSPADNLASTLTNNDLTDDDRLFGWAEHKYPDLFSPVSKISLQGFGYYFRYYSQTNSYLGTKDGKVYYLDPQGNILEVGAVSNYLPTAIADGF